MAILELPVGSIRRRRTAEAEVYRYMPVKEEFKTS